ncbi:TPA: hypothetical protein QCX47_003009 [Bacillus mycoides]|nr:hypothetical protein [Bacillus mycoides]
MSTNVNVLNGDVCEDTGRFVRQKSVKNFKQSMTLVFNHVANYDDYYIDEYVDAHELWDRIESTCTLARTPERMNDIHAQRGTLKSLLEESLKVANVDGVAKFYIDYDLLLSRCSFESVVTYDEY